MNLNLRNAIPWAALISGSIFVGFRLRAAIHEDRVEGSVENWRHFGRGRLGNVFHGGFSTGYFRRRYQLELFSAAPEKVQSTSVMYQLGWATLPGLRGLSVGEFRATPTATPDNERGVALEFADEAERDSFLQQLENNFAPRCFTNAADAFDTVKAYVLERAAKGI